MKRIIALLLLGTLLANPVLAFNLDAATVTSLKNAGVSDTQLNNIETAIADKQSLSAKELGQIMAKEGVTQTQISAAVQASGASIATGGAAVAGISNGLIVVSSIGLGVVVASAAAAVNDSINNNKDSQTVSTTGTL